MNKRRAGKMKKATDGFVNFASRMGLGAANMLSQATYVGNAITNSRVVLEQMYRGSWVVGKVVDSVAEDMTRAGVLITGKSDPGDIAKLQTAMTRLHVWRALLEAIKWGRLYGGAVSLIVIDGQDPSTPLDLKTIKKGQFKGLSVYDRWQLQPDLTKVIQEGPDMGLPQEYKVVGTTSMKPLVLHHSRIIRHIGIQLPFFQALTESLWGQSIVERLHDRLVPFDTATMGTANLVQKAHLRTVRIDGLREVLASGGMAEENLLKMFKYMAQLQTSEGVTLLDKNDEFDAHSYTFSGLSDVLMQFGQQIAGATGIPLVRLFGQSPAGLNSTGESDMRMYYDNIHAQQESTLRDGLLRVLRVLHQSMFGTEAAEDFDFDFAPLWQLSDEQRATIATSHTSAIASAYEKGIITLPTALKELRQSSEITGVFTNIEEAEITEADAAPPAAPTAVEQPAEPTEILDRIRTWLRYN